ncbi:uncharacterized protein M6B38_361750 [Iris pallida]|uniref:Uncharacterized protein n=1 Tax=Iris pallida TaxID=29817 RepID=A0AAX6GIW3_IRIPA|nr:uncharacterized protein M6B38_361750 [Iris pallida]
MWQRLHWKHASRMNYGLMLTTPLRLIDSGRLKVRLLHLYRAEQASLKDKNMHNHGLMLTTPLRPIDSGVRKFLCCIL